MINLISGSKIKLMMKDFCIIIIILSIFTTTIAISSIEIAQTKSNYNIVVQHKNDDLLSVDKEIRSDDGEYENAINWYSQYMSHNWDGWGKLFTADEFGMFRIRKIIISFQMFKGYNTPPSNADFDLAICPPGEDRKPSTGGNSGVIIWRQNFPPPNRIESYPKWSNFEYDVPNITIEKYFFVLWLPGWGTENVKPDPPILLCVDETHWYARSYGNLEGTYDWVLLKDLGIRGEFGIAVYGTGYGVGIDNSSIGQIRALFK